MLAPGSARTLGRGSIGVVDLDAAWMLPASVCRRWDMLALRVKDGIAVVATPEDQEPVAADVARAIVSRQIGAPTTFVEVPRADIEAAIDRIFGPVGAPAAPPGPALAAGRVDKTVARLLPDDLCRMLGLLPVVTETGEVAVAMADPGDRVARSVAVRTVQRHTGRPPACVQAPRAAIDRAIHEAFGRPAGPPVTLAPDPPPEPERAPRVLREVAPLEPAVRPATELLMGELLVGTGCVTDAQREWALQVQQRTGSRIGEILTHAGLLHEGHLLAALSRQLGLPLTDPTISGPTPKALAAVPAEIVQRVRVIPLEIREGTLTVATADPLDEEALGAVSRAAGMPVAVTLAMESAIDVEIQRLYAGQNVHDAVHALHELRPDASAYKVLSKPQVIFVCVLALLALVVGVIFGPITVAVLFTLAATVFYLTTSIYRFRLIEASLAHEFETPITKADIANLDERTLPVYTILLPMYREAEVVPKLLRSLTKLDYPTAKLDIKLLIEEDDLETRDAILALGLPPQFRLVIVPDALPKTKPKACNYGLIQARGEYVVIYDAEDEPEADQLKKVVAAFRKLDDPRVRCIQCKLNYFNRSQNLLTAWFTTEYSMWFDLIMPGLDASDVPIPLGGTSNHFLTSELRDLGAWDPYNVAEDADLGIRLSRAGHRTAVIDSTTFEEATSDVNNWIRQRSRWVKGYMQTWLVHMRHPVRLSRELGLRRFLSFQLVVGGTFATFLLNPIFWGLTTLWTLTSLNAIQDVFPGYLYYAAGVGLFVGNFLFTYLNAAGAVHRGHHDLVKYALLSPIYWGLMSIAAWKGAIQLVTRPHYWEKTLHGHDK